MVGGIRKWGFTHVRNSLLRANWSLPFFVFILFSQMFLISLVLVTYDKFEHRTSDHGLQRIVSVANIIPRSPIGHCIFWTVSLVHTVRPRLLQWRPRGLGITSLITINVWFFIRSTELCAHMYAIQIVLHLPIVTVIPKCRENQIPIENF